MDLMTVTVRNTNGVRYGSFNIGGISGKFPRQAMTTTNINHANKVGRPNLDFKTKFLEIVEKDANKLLTDRAYRQDRIKQISKILEQNSDKICTLVLNGAKTKLLATREQNIGLIDFQIDCNFQFIKTFFKINRNALQNSRDYRKMMPDNKTMVMVIDENLSNDIFMELYLDAYEKSDEMIGFLGREPNKSNDDNKLNYQFIASRADDDILRMVSFTRKDMGGVVSSLVYHWFGYDVYSFLTRFGSPNVRITELKALDGFKFRPVTRTSSFRCVVTGRNLNKSSRQYESEAGSSIPVSIHNIVRLNEEFDKIQTDYTKERIETMLGHRVF